jgi:hypothetical protein
MFCDPAVALLELSNYSHLCSGSTSNVLMLWSNANLGKERFPSSEKTKETQELLGRGSPAFYSGRKSCTTRTDLYCCKRNPTDWSSLLPVFVCLSLCWMSLLISTATDVNVHIHLRLYTNAWKATLFLGKTTQDTKNWRRKFRCL